MPLRRLGQASDHEANHTNAKHRLTLIQAHFIVAAQPPRFEEPTKGSFDYPTSRQDLEAFDVIRAPNNLQSEFAKGSQLVDPQDQRSQVTAVRPDDLQSAKEGHQSLD